MLLLLFAASGCAALINEMAWFHLVQLVVGASSISVAVLLCSFMGGMAAGSWFVPRAAPPARHPLYVIAWLEAGMAVLGVLIPLLLPYVQQIYVAAIGYGYGAVLMRALVCTIVLMPPTVLMGATLPIAARLLPQDPRGAAHVGRLYTANLVGGAFGTMLAGFYLMRVFDVYVASGVAAALNLLVAATASWLSRTSAPGTPAPGTPAPGTPAPRTSHPAPAPAPAPHAPYAPYAPLVLLVAFLSGFTALGAEVVWTRQLSLLFGASVYTFSLILAVFLAGLAIGGAIAARVIERGYGSRLTTLGGVQFALSMAIAAGAWMIVNALPQWQPTKSFLPFVHASPALTFAFDAARAATAMLPATILWGISFPLAIAAAGPRPRWVAAINAVNTLGALAGAVGLTLIGIPLLGSHVSQQVLVAGAAVAGAIALAPAGAAPRAVPLGAVVAMVAVLMVPAVPGPLIAYGRSVGSWDSIKRFLYLAEGSSASVAVTEGVGGARQFHIAGKVEASDMDIDMRLERMLGHVPALLHPRPRSVLIVGVGAGVTAGALAIHPDIERIVICEIEPVVPESARTYFAEENHRVFEDPRVQLVFDDARHFLQTTRETFDIITSDPIHPWVRGAATLYSFEYLQLAKAHLNTGGVVTQWIPLYETDERSVKSEIATFASVFPDTTLWNPDLLEEGYDLVALGQVGKTTIDESQIDSRIAASPQVRSSLEGVRLETGARILSTYAGRTADLAPWLAGAAINREKHLRLQYLAGLAANTDQRFYIFQSIVDYRRYPADLFVASAGLESQLRKWYAP